MLTSIFRANPPQEDDLLSTSEISEDVNEEEEEEEEEEGTIMDEEVIGMSDDGDSSDSSYNEDVFEGNVNRSRAVAPIEQHTDAIGGGGNPELQPQNTTFSCVTSDDWNAVDGPKGTVSWFRRRLGEMVHANSDMTVLDLVLWGLERKIGSNMSRKDFNEWMRMMKKVAPEDALIPPSWHVVKNIAGVGSIYDHMYHVCGGCFRYRYGWIPAVVMGCEVEMEN